MITQGFSQSSITLATTAKGAVQPEVKIYQPPDGPELAARPTTREVRDEALELARVAVDVLCKTVDELAIAGVPMVYDEATVRSMRNHYARAVGQKVAT